MKVDANFTHGANFAVAGSTVLPANVLADQNISSPTTNSSLSVQLGWMSKHFKSIYPNKVYAEKLENSLFILGEIGGNDYNYAIFQDKTIQEVQSSMVPLVVQAIASAIRSLIYNGAVRIVVPGQFPLGCFPIHLTQFQTNDSAAYDELHCLRDINNLLMYHNEQLQQAIEELKQEFPNAIVIYGDYYNAFLWFFANAQYFGFDVTLLQKSCCGIGGDYNFDPDPERLCGAPEVPVCHDPHRYISWDGIHMTQEAHTMMSTWIIGDILPELQCSVKFGPISLGRKSLKSKYLVEDLGYDS